MSDNKRRGGPVGGGMRHYHGMVVEKPKNFKKTFKRLVGYLKPWKNRMILVAIAAIFLHCLM